MSSAVVSRPAAGTASTSGRPALALPRLSCRTPQQRPAGFNPAILAPSRFDIIRAQAKKDERKAEPGAQPSLSNPDGTDDAPSPFIEPLIRGLVLGIGAGVLTEMLHVAFKVGETATDGGWHMPTGAQIYEQLAPLFVWDHAVAISFWMVFYIIEAAAILAILREYPDDKQASKVIRSTVTLPKRLMPLKLSAVKRALHGLISGRGAQQPVNPLWNFAAVSAVPVEARALLPSTSYVKITLGAGIQMITYVNTVPIDEHRSINRFCLIRNFALSPVFDDYTRKSMFKILGEDKAMIELLKPEQLLSEVSLEADKPQIAFRKLRQEWIDMGYGVQPDTTASHKGSLRVDM
eukprot:XP_001702280.1 predicted protein [Chlamydomonas reinhardtii]